MSTRSKEEREEGPKQYTRQTQDVYHRAVALWKERTGNKTTPELALLMEWLLMEAKRKK